MLEPKSLVAELVLAHSECASVLSRLRIDYCCRSERSLGEACADRGLDLDRVMAELERAIETREPTERDPRSLDTLELVAHIVARHHEYLREALPFVKQLAAKVARVHGPREPRLVGLDAVVRELSATLLRHIHEEEHDLFASITTGASALALAHMQDEHREVGRLLEAVRELSEDFRLPRQACGSYRALFAELEALEDDVRQHVHLENHVLAPRLVRL